MLTSVARRRVAHLRSGEALRGLHGARRLHDVPLVLEAEVERLRPELGVRLYVVRLRARREHDTTRARRAVAEVIVVFERREARGCLEARAPRASGERGEGKEREKGERAELHRLITF